MELDEAVINLMGRNHKRLTNQRKEILKILIDNENKHVSVDEIQRLAKENNIILSISTIYRTMDILHKIGAVIKHNFGNGISKYEVFMEEKNVHYHLICKKCGKIEEVFGVLGDDFNNRLLEEKEFQVEYHRLEVYGYCKDCMNHSK
ncbi:Fur family transcriptional regulator [Vallitalea sediminicola]